MILHSLLMPPEIMANHAYVAIIGILLAQYIMTGRCLAMNTASVTHHNHTRILCKCTCESCLPGLANNFAEIQRPFQMTEETRNAGTSRARCAQIAFNINDLLARSGSIGIVVSTGVSAVLRWFLMVGPSSRYNTIMLPLHLQRANSHPNIVRYCWRERCNCSEGTHGH